MNKQGQGLSILNVIIFMILGLVMLVLLAGFWYGVDLVNTSLSAIGNTTSGVDITDASSKTFGQVASALPLLRFTALAFLFGMIMLTMITGFFGRTHPLFYAVYLLMIPINIIVSVAIANAHDTLIGKEIFNGILSNFTGVNYIYSNLPVWVTIISFIGVIFILVNIIRDSEQGGSII